MIERVISGGQVGADIAGLRAAKQLGISTGGWMPAGFKTLAGPKPEYQKEFGLKEMESPLYKDRTRENVKSSDGTIRLAIDFGTPGERCTVKWIEYYEKPHFDFALVDYRVDIHIDRMIQWAVNNEIKVLNVAGNARISLEPIVEIIMVKFLRKVNDA